ncbi:MAG: ABC transporter permease [Thermodesulfobacteriota bacterium]
MFQFLKRYLIKSFLPAILVVTYLAFGLVQPQFLTGTNLINILRQSSYLIMLATAQLVVLIPRGFDLSVGPVIGTISVGASMVMVGVAKGGAGSVLLAVVLAWLTALAIGFVVGAINGVAVAYFGVSPFMATLGMMGIGLGFATTISGGFPVTGVPVEFVNVFARGNLLGLPVPVIVCIIVLALVHFMLQYTVLGRSLYLLGSSPRAAYVAGVPTRRRLAWAYVVCSMIVAVVALMLTARTGTGEPRLGMSLMFESLMAAIIGGVSLAGGEGTILNCIIGGLFVTVLSNGMNLSGIDSNIQLIILGTILIVTIVVDQLRIRIRI